MEKALPAQPASPKTTFPANDGPQDAARFSALLSAVGKKQDRAAFVELFDHFAPRVKSFLIKGGISADQADELSQETMLTVWQRAASFDPAQASASTWIFTIARNKRIDLLRKAYRPQLDMAEPSLLPEEEKGAETRLSAEDETKRLTAALKDIPPEQADLLYKSFFEDKTHKDIAEETALPLGTVKSRIRLAMDRLRRTLEAAP